MTSPNSQVTCWSLIHGAVAGDEDARAEFFQRYEAAARRYLGARWKGTPYLPQLEDAAQQVFLECFQEGGALQRVDEERRFSPFLYGVVKRVAQKFEKDKARELNRKAPGTFHPEQVQIDEASASQAFDRTYWVIETREGTGWIYRDSGGGWLWHGYFD